MENISLTSEEKKELDKRGFYVKENITIKELIKRIGLTSVIFLGGIVLGSMMIEFEKIVIFNVCIFSLLYFPLFFSYLKSNTSFYGKDGVLGYGKLEKNDLNIQKKNHIQEIIFEFITTCFKLLTNVRDIVYIPSRNEAMATGYVLSFYFVIIFWGLGIWTDSVLSIFHIYTGATWVSLLIGILPIIGIIPLNLIGKISIGIFNPLYAFGNLGEKIQKLTPTIESQSRLIQSEFEKEQNFGVLHSGFEKLSSTFSKIVSLIIRLEKVEARANKGNLFDSEKYINSLRGDIVIPLEELRKFLEEQRKKLVQSRKELSQVQVRVGGDEFVGNKELSSKRSESIIQELDENIGKLNEMIRKMG